MLWLIDGGKERVTPCYDFHIGHMNWGCPDGKPFRGGRDLQYIARCSALSKSYARVGKDLKDRFFRCGPTLC